MPAPTPMESRFVRDPALPFIECREVADGRAACYARHSHDTFSVGAITGGASRYLNGHRTHDVDEGAVVVMNAGDVHACNPVDGAAWSYRMLFVDTAWLARVQDGLDEGARHDADPWSMQLGRDPALYRGVNALCRLLRDADADALKKASASVGLFSALWRADQRIVERPLRDAPPSRHVAEYLEAHCARPVTLDELCQVAGRSASHVLRSFKAEFGMTPHRYLLDCRLRAGRRLLKQGAEIAEAAADTGFADQAHFQREFKRAYAMTPGHYRDRRASARHPSAR